MIDFLVDNKDLIPKAMKMANELAPTGHHRSALKSIKSTYYKDQIYDCFYRAVDDYDFKPKL